MGDIFSIDARKYACFCGLCVDEKGCALNQYENDGYSNNRKISCLIQRDHIQFQHGNKCGLKKSLFQWIMIDLFMLLEKACDPIMGLY